MVNNLETKESYWIRYTLVCPQQINLGFSSEDSLDQSIDKLGGGGAIWISYFNADNPSKNFVIKKKFPLSSVSGSSIDENMIIDIGGNRLTLDSVKGSFETTKGKSVDINLTFSNFVEAYYPIPYFGYWLGITNTYLSNGHPNLRISGTIKIDNNIKEIKNAIGHQTHTYGDAYLEPWTWFHCNTFKNHPDVFLECGFKHRLEKGTLGFYDGTKSHFFNTLFTMKRIKELERSPTKVIILLDNYGEREDFLIEISVPKESLIGLEYLGPKGNKFYCYNSETSSIKLSRVFKNGTILEEYEAKQSLDFETVWFEPQEGLPFLATDDEIWENSEFLKKNIVDDPVYIEKDERKDMEEVVGKLDEL